VNIPVIVSGGVSSIEDLRNLKKIENLGLEGVIIGKALYDNKISLPEALRV
jgi:phosphoribosylformimino-5-aminoimidazole carboxamide ribonucleotide (ProFAR) isomerase